MRVRILWKTLGAMGVSLLVAGCASSGLVASRDVLPRAFVAGSAGDPGEEHDHPGHGVQDVHVAPPLGATLRGGWTDCWVHSHASWCATPLVHGFRTEPAFLGREVFLHLEEEGDTQALEAEVEWALTRRLGLLVEVPYEFEEARDGFSDPSAGIRALLAETSRFIFAATLEVSVPVGASDFTADEWGLAPSVSAWADLGGWWTAQGQVGLDVGASSGDVGLSWSVLLAKSLRAPLLLPGSHHPGFAGHAHDHGSARGTGPTGRCCGILSLMAEVSGVAALRGPEEGAWRHEVLLGLAWSVAESVDLRAAFTLAWEEEEEEAAAGWLVGFAVRL